MALCRACSSMTSGRLLPGCRVRMRFRAAFPASATAAWMAGFPWITVMAGSSEEPVSGASGASASTRAADAATRAWMSRVRGARSSVRAAAAGTGSRLPGSCGSGRSSPSRVRHGTRSASAAVTPPRWSASV
ncbi:hypothetical protein SCALM49S_05593 [Streptomyces californicus]